MDVKFRMLIEPGSEIAECFQKWETDPVLIPLIRPNRDKDALETKEVLTVQDLEQRLEHNHTFLIYLEDQLIGEMDYQIDPKQVYKKEAGTAWIGIVIGEEIARGKGIGQLALRYLEEQIRLQGLTRIELGVFEFNEPAIRLYKRSGYQEIARLENFTYWQGKMWQDIRMEKYV
jgi:RimJ/RimL family protein N-acetyltransferase